MLDRISKIAVFFMIMAGALVLPAWAQGQEGGRPGTVNYVEGQAWIGSTPLTAESVRSMELARGETLTTKTGKVELLLTPGVFLRVDDNSSVRMVSPDLANIDVSVETGRASVEVLNIMKANDIRLDLNAVSTRLLDDGLYEFDANRGQVLVFQGKAEVYDAGQTLKLKGGRMATLAAGPLMARKFDTRKYEDNLYRWASLRSGYLAQASVDAARAHAGAGPGWYGPGWYGPGWYWDTGFLSYTFLPADGVFYGPFGWGFYSPIMAYGAPYYFGSYYGGGHHRFGDFREHAGGGFEPGEGFHAGRHLRAGTDFDEGRQFHEGRGDHDGGGGFHGEGGVHGRHAH